MSKKILNDEESRLQFVASEFMGPTKSRQCTYIMFLILFILMFVCMNGIGFAAVGLIPSPYIQTGSPLRLIRGVDYMGAVCGVDDIVKGLENKWEPNAFGINPNSNGLYVPTGLGICVSSCPAAGESRSDIYGEYGSWIAPVTTSDVLGYCLPFNTMRVENLAKSMFGDFIRVFRVIAVLGVVVAVACSILFLVTIRIPGVLRSIVWLSIWLILGIFVCGGYIILNKVKSDEKLTGANAPSTQQVRGILMFFIFFHALKCWDTRTVNTFHR